jgi:deoxyribodipyrimidine photo-lyase
MTANRRVGWNFSFERAVEWAEELQKPLVVLEALRCGYKWASDRLHRFVLDGMEDNARRLAKTAVHYYPYVERRPDAGKGLLKAWAQEASVLVTDDFPSFFLPKMVNAAARQLPVRLEKVDSNGLLPMRVADKVYARAYDFRRFIQKALPEHLLEVPETDPLQGAELRRLAALPDGIEKRWPRSSADLLQGKAGVDDFPIDHSVPVVDYKGGRVAALATLKSFLSEKFDNYDALRNEPEQNATSGLSPYLHFGHISVHEIFAAIVEQEGWSPARLSDRASGSRSGWWGMRKAAEAFMDELVTWRELGYNMCWQKDDYDRFESLPDWAQATLMEHASDPREFVYSLQEFETSQTHDPLWNAAQTQLVREGRIHNYLRMLWGKKILEWSAKPQDALGTMIELNNKYAVDGRNPNSYSGIFWVLGRYDRAWGPERPIFGKIRYMSSENTARKLKIKNYIQKYGSS